ncbi:PorT family protein [Sediminibacterium roseum]|uniref:PorT family protein n=1 Tax=Sediminibacterium roseum TaxID=1978412 RepID=A0ABW9ZTS4_9BACT|nr:porin family protein [Sediminibacterium roseum]NCI50531.1 PorT family protein [Sediminibacterium roseum]
MKNPIRAISLAVLTMALFVVSNPSSAQEVSRRNPTFGIKGGINLNNLYVDNVTDQNMKVGANVGLYAKLPVATGFAVQPEITYSMKGSQTTYNSVLGSGKYRFNLDYLEVPVAAVVNIAPNFNIHAGPYVAFLLSAKVKDVDANGTVNGVTQLNTDNFHSTDWGLFGGLGFDIGGATLGARYTKGFQEVGKPGATSNFLQNAKNSGFTFYVGIGL